LCQKLYHRSFNQNFGLGGRLYGPFWQRAPSALRKLLTIDGERTDERDWSQFHPRLLYALKNATLSGSAYDVPGFSRDDAKLAFAILINAESERDAHAALRLNLGLRKGIGETARKLYEGIKEHHAPIASLFASGAGLRLQRLDGDLIVRVHLRLLHQGVCALSVHDSVIVAERHRAVRDAVMDEELDELIWKLQSNPGKSLGPAMPSQKTVPQKGPDTDFLPASRPSNLLLPHRPHRPRRPPRSSSSPRGARG
jgi:hypothetical protein